MTNETSEPRAFRIPAISTAMYPLPETTTFLYIRFIYECNSNYKHYFGSSSNSKKPSLVIPNSAPLMHVHDKQLSI